MYTHTSKRIPSFFPDLLWKYGQLEGPRYVNIMRLHFENRAVTILFVHLGAVLRLGRGHVFRFNNAKEAERMREELKMVSLI